MNASRLKFGLSACAVLIAGLLATARTVSVLAQTRGLDGSYAFANSQQELQALRAALIASTKALQSDARDELRSRLEEITRPAQQLTLASAGGELIIQHSTTETLRSRSDGSARAIGPSTSLTQRLSGTTLVQQLNSGELSQQYVYRPTNNGRGVIVQVVITGPNLKPAIQYQLTYQRL